MLSFVKKYVMKKIGYGSSSKPINIEDIKTDYESLVKSTFKSINTEDIKTDYESLVKSTFKSINTEDIKIGHESLFKSTDRTYSQYSLSNLLKDIGNINNVDNINMNYKPAKEGQRAGVSGTD